ncbi:hypothetical protein FG379_002905 [Cryptosporidium bovis]|uniref:uncharacterized protein n=1 Tax=Cryptosporidium bovis TaxID=310047 RepID=UPI00351A8213|nr:hypothetical protein FG379_002905 [Cryptosporidium bovis]
MVETYDNNELEKSIDNETRPDIEMKMEDDTIMNNDDDSSTPMDNGIENSESFLRREVDLHYKVANEIKDGLKMSNENNGEEGGMSRLKLLLDQSEAYTSYILARSLNSVKYEKKKKCDSGEEHGIDVVNYNELGVKEYSESIERVTEKGKNKKFKIGDKHEHIMNKEDDTELFRETEEEIYGYRTHTRLQAQPSCIENGQLKPYQLEGLNWLINLYEGGLNGILADEMGLGKTFQSISLMAYLREYRKIKGLHLVLSPKSTIGNWMNEINKFCPSINAIKFLGNVEERSELINSTLINVDNRNSLNGSCDVIVTSYEMLLKEKSWFMKRNYHSIIIDEAHRIKNEASKLSQTVRMLKTRFRLLLTGTPLQNSLKELWSLLNFLYPEIFASSDEFEGLFESQNNEDENTIIGRFHKILRPFMLRRVKSEVEIDIPPKKEILLYVPLTNMQRNLYKDLLSKNVDALQEKEGGKLRLINLAMQLRKACNHPYLFDGYEDKTVDPFGEHVVENSGKMILMDRLIKKLINNGSRILIFSQMSRVLDILEDYCYMRKYPYCRIDGNTSGDDRDKQIYDFNKEGSDKLVFLLSTRAGGLGINLATADIVILYDSDWNPQVDLQAMDRAHRIGQKKPVFVFRLCHEHTIEEKIIERANLKLQLDFAIIQQGRLKGLGAAGAGGSGLPSCVENNSNILSKNELMNMIQYGANEILKATNVNITDEDIEAIISGGEKRTESLQMKVQKHIQGSLLNFSLNNHNNGREGDKRNVSGEGTGGGNQSINSLYEFEGIDYNEIQKQQDRQAWGKISIEKIDQEREERRRGRMENYTLKLINKYINKQSSLRGLDKLPPMYEWQFYDKKRIMELHNKETKYLSELNSSLVKLSQKSNMTFIDENSLLIPETDVPLSNSEIKDLTIEEKEEKKKLIQSGFKNWTRREFNLLLRAIESKGIENISAISNYFPNKDEKEVREYIDVLMKRGPEELTDWSRYIKRIQSSKEDQKKKQEFNEIIKNKLSQYSDPWRELELESLNIYNKQGKNMNFTSIEDRYILNYTLIFGYGNWEQILLAIKSDHIFSFNWFIKTRDANDIYKRVDYIIKAIKRNELNKTNNNQTEPFIVTDTKTNNNESENSIDSVRTEADNTIVKSNSELVVAGQS